MLWLLEFRHKGRTRKSRWEVDQSWLNFTNQQKPQYEQKEEFGLDDIKSMWTGFIILLLRHCLFAKIEEKDIDFGKSCKMKLILESWAIAGYLKSHKSVEKLESEKLEDMLNDFLSGKRSYASKLESWKDGE